MIPPSICSRRRSGLITSADVVGSRRSVDFDPSPVLDVNATLATCTAEGYTVMQAGFLRATPCGGSAIAITHQERGDVELLDIIS